MKTKTLQQTVTFKATPREVYDMLMVSKKHQSLSGEPAKMLLSAVGILLLFGFNFFAALPLVLSGIGAVLALLSAKEARAKAM